MNMSEILTCQNGSRLGKLDEDGSAAPPALPPRPPPRPRNSVEPLSSIEVHLKRKRVKKYVFLCSVCGGLASLLGSLFLAVYLILRAYTSSLDYFETIPTYIPAAMLMVTGLAVMCLARRRNRYIFLIKLCGLCCLICVGTCVMVTVTTTVVHMNRLQSLRECVYTLKTQTCTCYSVLLESASERTDEGSRYVFNATPDCEAIHGALYSCLRALFGLSVIGILVCIFCCMLVYQLLSHERKKMYWEQLELRCRYLYGQVANPVRNNTLAQPPSSQPTQHCACCQQFRYQQDILAWESSDNRFWSGGQVGNLYSPNPVGEECLAVPLSEPSSTGWSWRRLPWNRQPTNTLPPVTNNSQRGSDGYHRPIHCSSPDSQYGFSSEPGRVATVSSGSASYTVIDPVVQSSSTVCNNYHWGPPPPYSDPNSPSRQVLCPPGPHHHHCQRNTSGDRDNESENSRVLQLRIPIRRPDMQLSSSSSSSVKSNAIQTPNELECSRNFRTSQKQELKAIHKKGENDWRECSLSPRIKYVHNKLQNSSINISRVPSNDQSESEVYFADVSSCNVSVRNDSISIYGEAPEGKTTLRMPNVSEGLSRNNEESLKNHLQTSEEERNITFSKHTTPNSQGNVRSSINLSRKSVNSFNKGVTCRTESSYSGGALECSEDEDLELVNLSQQQASLKRQQPFYSRDANKVTYETTPRFSEGLQKKQNELPLPMPLPPSNSNKPNGEYFAEVFHSDNGSSDSVWSEYSADLLAPDAQYEVIPEHRTSTEDLNGNTNENNENHGKVKMYLFPKKRHYSYKSSENWQMNTNPGNSSDNQDFINRHSCSGQKMSSKRPAEKTKEIENKVQRSNENCISDILNSSKHNYKGAACETNSNSSGKHFINIQEDDPSLDCDQELPGLMDEGLYCVINENDTIRCDRTNHNFACSENPQQLNLQETTGNAVITSIPTVPDNEKLNSNFKNLDFSENKQSSGFLNVDSNNCKGFKPTDFHNSDLNHVRSVDV